MRKHLLSIIILFIVACGPLPQVIPTIAPIPTPEEVATVQPPQYLNANHELSLGECRRVAFNNQWGVVYVTQCTPQGYTLHQDTSFPIGIDHTGEVYSIRPRGAKGEIGFTSPQMELEAGQYLIKVYGQADIWGSIGDYWLQTNITGGGYTNHELGKHPLTANGDYMAMFPFCSTRKASYSITSFLSLVHASMTDGSYLTIRSITVGSTGDCEN